MKNKHNAYYIHYNNLYVFVPGRKSTLRHCQHYTYSVILIDVRKRTGHRIFETLEEKLNCTRRSRKQYTQISWQSGPFILVTPLR